MAKVMDMIEVRRKGSIRGMTDSQRATLVGLGLGKNGRTRLLEDTNAVRGMINKMVRWVDYRLVPAAQAEGEIANVKAKKSRPKGYRVVSANK